MDVMSDLLSHFSLYSVSGLFVGCLVGLTGVGGGSLMTPLLILLFGVHPATAVGTDLLYAAVTKSVATAVHGLKGTVDWPITLRLAAGSVPTTVLTIALLHNVSDHGHSYAQVLSPVLAVSLVLTAVSLVLRRQILNLATRHLTEMRPAMVTTLTVLSGAVLGVLVSLTSVGAGAIGMTALVLLYPRHEIVRLIGSDIAHAVPLTLLAGIGHWYLGAIDGGLLVSLLIGSVPGVVIGSQVAARAPGAVLRPILAVVLLVAARQLVAH